MEVKCEKKLKKRKNGLKTLNKDWKNTLLKILNQILMKP
jgi:hypothetical protein